MIQEKLRRFGLDKVVLLLLLLAGFIIAKFIVSSQSKLKLSKPIALQGSGLSVSVPAGFTQASESFQYNDNEFRLASILQISGRQVISAHWRYFLLPFEMTVSKRFETIAQSFEGTIEKNGSEKFGQLNFDYAKIVSEKKQLGLFTGTASLPDGRTLTLEIIYQQPNDAVAEKLFEALAASAEFQPDNALADGNNLLSRFRQTALASAVKKNSQQNYYYIESQTNQPLGFATDAISIKGNSLVAANLYYIHSGKISFAEQSLLRGEPNLRSFKWMSQRSNISANPDLTTTIELAPSGEISVRKNAVVKSFVFTSSMLPDSLLDVFVENFAQSDFNSVMIDLILSDGRLQPALVSRTESKKSSEQTAAHAVGIIFFGIDSDYQTAYFDSGGKLISSATRGKISYKLTRTTQRRLFTDFPDWLEKIRQIQEYIFPNNEKEK